MTRKPTHAPSDYADDRARNEAVAADTLKRIALRVEGRKEITAPFAFSPYLALASEDLRSICGAVLPTLTKLRGRAFRETDLPRIEKTIGAIVANTLVAGVGTFTHYSRNKARIKRGDAYSPEWLTIHNLGRQVVDLGRAGLLTEVKSFQGLDVRSESVFAGTPALAELCAMLSITPGSVRYSEEDAVIVLKDVEDNRILQFDRTAEPYARMGSDLRTYNGFLARQVFGAFPPLNRAEIDFRRTRMFRVFQGGPTLHGRFYGGFWQDLKRDERPNITINGEPTREWDFRGFVVATLYHQAGLSVDRDPYDIPAVRTPYESAGWSWDDTRKIVKRMVQVVINGSDLWRHHGKIECAPGFTLRQAEEAILAFHQPIAASFSRTCGLRIMNVDARIAESILHKAITSEKVVLPIHDGFITSKSNSDWLKETMISSYRDELGFLPSIH